MKNNLTTSCYDIVNRVLKERRTVHEFDSRPVPVAVVENAIETIRWAPNHYLSEPWRVYLIGPTGKSKIIALNSKIIESKRGAKAASIKSKRWQEIPGWLLVNCVREGDEAKRREDYAACCCGIQNLMLSLWSAEIGTKWTTGEVTRDPAFAQIVGFDENKESVVGLLWFGFSKLVKAQKRRPISSYLFRIP
mgnify:CR=1 FL=1